ncbi:MAG: hypothetical protein JW790_03590 [Dehalococcoidales bacterium]|nr:hypothetical protein [Dehalococcoidales bacterium]
MKRFKRVRYLLCLVLLTGLIGIQSGAHLALADDEEETPPVEERLELVSRFPVKQGESGTSFEFEVDISYQGNETKMFEFNVDPPEGWDIAVNRYITSEEAQASILAMTIEPNQAYPSTVVVMLSPLPGNQPEPGEYTINFEAFSGSLSDSVELKAVVTELPLAYEVTFATVNGRLDFPVKPGEGNSIMVKITNTGSGDLTNLSFTSVKSEGWGATFTPNRIETLVPGQSTEAEVIMTPPQNTIAGDYRVYVRVGADTPDARLQEELDLRIRVQTPTVWGAAGIAIVVAVIVALAVMFRRLGRR